MIEFLTAVVLFFSGVGPGTLQCPQQIQGATAYVVLYTGEDRAWDMYLPRYMCRDLLRPKPARFSIDVFTHEMVHVRFPRVKHGAQMERAIRRWRSLTCFLLGADCSARYPTPDRRIP